MGGNGTRPMMSLRSRWDNDALALAQMHVHNQQQHTIKARPASGPGESGGVCNRGDLPLVGELISARGAPATLLAVGRHRLVLCQ